MRKMLNWLAPLALVGIVLVFFAKMAFTDLILARGDMFKYFFPYWHGASQALQSGRIPLWNDMIFTGAPFMANSQVGLFYPPNWPLWLFIADITTAIKITTLLHVTWAGLGTLLLLRRPMRMGWLAAFTGSALFAVGGHLTAHVEQVNQLQGLSWLPWLFLILMQTRKKPWLWSPILAIGLAMQLLSGHTQTVFIGLVGMGLMSLWWSWSERATRPPTRWLMPLLPLLAAGPTALVLTLPQLLPTLELSSLSNRSGGLLAGDVLSFSLHPVLLGRALLPGYDVALHNEYVGSIGVAGLILALLGSWFAFSEKSRLWQGWVIISAIGLLFALGNWSPVYLVLARLPGFNLFRVPARWLALWALGSSILAALAVQQLWAGRKGLPRHFAVATLIIVGALVGDTFLSPLTNEVYLKGMLKPAPTALLIWLASTVIIVVILLRLPPRRTAPILVAFSLVEILAAAQLMPFNQLTVPEAYQAERPVISQMLLHQQDSHTPAGRTLTISDILFGLSDEAALRDEFGHRLTLEGMFDLLVATKLKDVLGPNVNMMWQLPSADGFDGGVLPIRNYTVFSRLLMENPQPDGRLREYLTGIPEQRWLDLMGIRYIITDRLNDPWIGDIQFDTSWTAHIGAGQTLAINGEPNFDATDVAVLSDAGADAVSITAIAGTNTVEGVAVEIIENPPHTAIIYSLGERFAPDSIELTARDVDTTIIGAALLDDASGTFQALTIAEPYRWHLAYANDVKLYENAVPSPRAWLVHEAEVIANDDAALERMRRTDFDPMRTVVLADAPPLARRPGR